MNQYQIAWTNTENSVTGCGKKLFSEDEARALCAELNRDYPHIEHVPKLADAPSPQPESETA